MGAAEPLQALSRYVLCEVHVHQWPLDASSAMLRAVKNDELSDDAAITRLERSPFWVWTAMDPESTRLVVMDVGTRSLAMAPRVGHPLVGV